MDRAYRLAYGRSPNAAEGQRAVAFVRKHGLAAFCRVLLSSSEFVYVRNFAADRWPMGSPGAVGPETPPAESLETDTRVAFADMDASPTKAWLVAHRDDPMWKWHYDFAFGRRPEEELYDLAKDPDQVRNVAADPAYAKVKQEMSERLMKLLTEAGDPRVTGDGQTFDRPPFTDLPGAGAKGKGKGKGKAKKP